MALKRAVFLDKDGTLLEDVPYNADCARIRLRPGAVEALLRLKRLGYELAVASNQPGVALGRFPRSALAGLEAHLEGVLGAHGIRLLAFCWCPHHPDGSVAEYAVPCACRKPQPGLLLEAARAHGIDLAQSWMVGDILDDIEAGRRAGCRTVLLDVGSETEWRAAALRTPHAVVRSLVDAARAIERAPREVATCAEEAS
jgi:D-glycero-D-manno-heptose 1,7-bisphosphate phosphatase